MLLKDDVSPQSKHGDPGVDQVQLGGGITVGKYRRLVSESSREALATFVHARFLERYIMPLEEVPRRRRSGFLIMAACCLMIEALESFKRGWPDTKNLDGKPFKEFFSKDVYLKTCGMKPGAFWRHVRCELLHQAETTGGWCILRKGPKVDAPARTINATSFLAHVRARLDEYRDELKQAGWDDEIWGNFRKKMGAICKNRERV